MKPFLSNKNIITTQIKRKEKEKVVTDGLKLSNEFSNFFESVVKSLKYLP